MAEQRVGQVPVESFETNDGKARVSQIPVEVLDNSTGLVRAAQIPIEVVYEMARGRAWSQLIG